jgi:hypothetical protein
MSFPPQHELHRRRFGRNLGVGLLLAGFIVLVFALTVVKVTRGEAPAPQAATATTAGATP